MAYLSSQQIQYFNENGYLVIPNFWNRDTVEELKAEMTNILRKLDLMSSRSVFTTENSMAAMNRDSHFLESGDTIKHFWEENAFTLDGTPTRPLEECINKVGHALHDLNEKFQRVSYDLKIGLIARDLGLKDPVVPQSMYIFKSPQIGGAVNPHQDGTFLYTQPQSVVGFWWALDDCTLDNGCLWAIPGSHTLPVTRRFKRLPAPEIGTEFVPAEAVEYSVEGGVPLEMQAGDLVLIHNAVVHWSAPNTSDKQRHSYSIHVVDSSEHVSYPADNWLQRSDGEPFNKLIV